MDPKTVPQFFTLTFDDAVQAPTVPVALALMVLHPNGCPIKATRFAQTIYCDYSHQLVKQRQQIRQFMISCFPQVGFRQTSYYIEDHALRLDSVDWIPSTAIQRCWTGSHALPHWRSCIAMHFEGGQHCRTHACTLREIIRRFCTATLEEDRIVSHALPH
ncbi:hypothetical protein B0O80DRAFT_452333 [Mortierella sp. GBAus27b]|nr:hypothetical protein B0O80DRAFT_452333 [Mortierella sp. GBAus27b]